MFLRIVSHKTKFNTKDGRFSPSLIIRLHLAIQSFKILFCPPLVFYIAELLQIAM